VDRVYNKLVRDKIPGIIMHQGELPVYRKLDDAEYLAELKRKLQEEMSEFLTEDDPEELADLYEVMDAIAQFLGGKEKILELQRKKQERNGGFADRIYLQEVKERI